MPDCTGIHKEYSGYANSKPQRGVLPSWTHVQGKVVWSVHQGSYRGLAEAWDKFNKELSSMPPEKFAGPPGDVYACSPMDHKGKEETMITILYAPVTE